MSLFWLFRLLIFNCHIVCFVIVINLKKKIPQKKSSFLSLNRSSSISCTTKRFRMSSLQSFGGTQQHCASTSSSRHHTRPRRARRSLWFCARLRCLQNVRHSFILLFTQSLLYVEPITFIIWLFLLFSLISIMIFLIFFCFAFFPTFFLLFPENSDKLSIHTRKSKQSKSLKAKMSSKKPFTATPSKLNFENK